MEYDTALKRHGILPPATTWIYLRGDCTEGNESEKDKCHRTSLIYRIVKKINEQTKQKQTHRYREHFNGYRVGTGGLRDWVKQGKGLRYTHW